MPGITIRTKKRIKDYPQFPKQITLDKAFDKMSQDFRRTMGIVYTTNNWKQNNATYLKYRKSSGKDNFQTTASVPGIRTRELWASLTQPGRGVIARSSKSITFGTKVDHIKFLGDRNPLKTFEERHEQQFRVRAGNTLYFAIREQITGERLQGPPSF